VRLLAVAKSRVDTLLSKRLSRLKVFHSVHVLIRCAQLTSPNSKLIELVPCGIELYCSVA
jgi:hypothetical protein